MREDLIERLRREADISARPGQMDRLNELADEFAAALEAAREDGWRPIETAPKDGARVMLGNEHGAWVADWRPVYQSGYRPDTPWHSAMLNCDHIAREHRYKPATHWRALRAPPAIDQARGKSYGASRTRTPTGRSPRTRTAAG